MNTNRSDITGCWCDVEWYGMNAYRTDITGCVYQLTEQRLNSNIKQ